MGSVAGQVLVLQQLQHIQDGVRIVLDHLDRHAEGRVRRRVLADALRCLVNDGLCYLRAAVAFDRIVTMGDQQRRQVAVAAGPLVDALQGVGRRRCAIGGKIFARQRHRLPCGQVPLENEEGHVEGRGQPQRQVGQRHAPGDDNIQRVAPFGFALHVGGAQRVEQLLDQVVGQRLEVVDHQDEVSALVGAALLQEVLKVARPHQSITRLIVRNSRQWSFWIECKSATSGFGRIPPRCRCAPATG